MKINELLVESPVMSPSMKNKMYYHGTHTKANALSIIKNGIQPRNVEIIDRTLNPLTLLNNLPNHVYLTTDILVAIRYASSMRNHRFGYVFGIPGESLVGSIVPDDDAIYEFIRSLLLNERAIKNISEASKKMKNFLKLEYKSILESPINDKDVPEVIRHELLALCKKYSGAFENNKWDSDWLDALYNGSNVFNTVANIRPHISERLGQWMVENDNSLATRQIIRPTNIWKVDNAFLNASIGAQSSPLVLKGSLIPISPEDIQ